MHTKKTIAAAFGCALAVAGSACSGTGDTPDGTAGEVGSLAVALTVEGPPVDRVDLTIESQDLDPAITRSRSVDVADPNATVSATEAGLPAGGYGVSLSAQVVDDPDTAADESQITCAGSVAGVAVVPGEITDVDHLVLVCTLDGGQLATAGGLRVTAVTEYEEITTCGDLIQALSVAPLDTSAGQSVDLAVVSDPSAHVAWSADHGTFAVDGSRYTCPEVPGDFTIEATVTAADGCEETFEEVIGCHTTSGESCEPLPDAFAFEGSCGLRSPCTVTQNGCDWEITCRGQAFNGEGHGAFYHASGDRCQGAIVDGELVGTCMDSAGEVCDFNTSSNPDPVPHCAQLPDVIDHVSACGQSWSACEVIQDRTCRYQVRCEGGEVLYSTVSEDSLRWDFTTAAGQRMRCSGDIVDGAVAGTCQERGRGLDNPRTCDDFTASVPTPPSVCDETLANAGLVIAGCGLDSPCFALQRGCAWELNCGGTVYGGLASETNAFAFTAPGGRACVFSVVDGAIEGGCGSESGACAFAETDPSVDQSCLQLPKTVEARGCGFGAPTPFQVIQDGCDVQAYAPSRAVGIVATVTERGMSFPGISPGWVCALDLTDDGTALLGGCTRDNGDGTVSQCRDLGDDAPLVLRF